LLLGRKDINVKGVFAPEGSIDPELFLRGISKRGIKIQEVEERATRLTFGKV
jgi:hypothetical protein